MTYVISEVVLGSFCEVVWGSCCLA